MGCGVGDDIWSGEESEEKTCDGISGLKLERFVGVIGKEEMKHISIFGVDGTLVNSDFLFGERTMGFDVGVHFWWKLEDEAGGNRDFGVGWDGDLFTGC